MEVPLAEELVAGSPLYVELALFHLCWETWLKVRGLLEVRRHLVWSPLCLVLEGFLKDIFKKPGGFFKGHISCYWEDLLLYLGRKNCQAGSCTFESQLSGFFSFS